MRDDISLKNNPPVPNPLYSGSMTDTKELPVPAYELLRTNNDVSGLDPGGVKDLLDSHFPSDISKIVLTYKLGRFMSRTCTSHEKRWGHHVCVW